MLHTTMKRAQNSAGFFQPTRDMVLHIGEQCFAFLPHPLFPDDPDAVYVLEGSSALIYQVRDSANGDIYALKTFKRSFRHPYIVQQTNLIKNMLNGNRLEIARRICLSPDAYPELITAYPALSYAVLMPWIHATSWSGLMQNPAASAHFTRTQALQLATSTAQLLAWLKSLGMAHSDLSGANVLIEPTTGRVHLLDLENLFFSQIPASTGPLLGTPGYQHRNPGPNGQRCLAGDRFAGAVLLTEMLTWWDPRVRALVDEHADSLFLPDELQAPNTPRWSAARTTLHQLSPDLLALFDQAWFSSDLDVCPKMSEWADVILSLGVFKL